MLNRIFVVSSATLTSAGTAVSCMVPFDTTCMKMPTQIVVKATGQGAYVRLSSNASAATNADVLVQGGDHVVLSVNGRRYISVLSDGASSTVSIGALSTGVWGDAMSLSTVLFGAGQQGVWYDPSDASTLFSDTAGTTPSPTPGAGALSVVGKMLDKSGNGNHAISYNTTTARPELSARVNLLTYSEQFDNAAWTRTNVTVDATGRLAPDGTNTADLLYPTATSGSGTIAAQVQNVTGAQGTYTVSYRIKPSGFNWAIVAIRNIAGNKYIWQWFNIASPAVGSRQTNAFTLVSATIVPTANGYYVCTLTVTTDVADSGLSTFVGMSDADNNFTTTANGTNGIIVWGADLRPANIGTSVPAYQRIADQYTYDSSGFQRYLVFNGTASGMYTPANLNLSGTDKATVFAGARKLVDTPAGSLVELSASPSANTGIFALSPGDFASGTGAVWLHGARGTAAIASNQYAVTPANYAAPISNVLTGQSDIGASTSTIRANGTLQATATGAKGTGNFGSYPLYIGSRNNSVQFLNGYIYSLIVVGAASTAAQISSTESWINVKEGTVY